MMSGAPESALDIMTSGCHIISTPILKACFRLTRRDLYVYKLVLKCLKFLQSSQSFMFLLIVFVLEALEYHFVVFITLSP